jgi:hypothetical protein
MSLENAKWIHELMKTNPQGTDVISQGDNHIRMIKEVLKDTFPSDFDGAMIPDITGNAGKVLAINAGGTAIEWVAPYSPPDYTALTWFKINATATSIPIDAWTPMNMSHTIATEGVYLIMSGINKLGSYDGEFKDNGMILTINGADAPGGSTGQYTAYFPTRADHNFLATSGIFELSDGDIIGMNVFQDNGPNVNITIGPEAYINILRIQ